MCHFQRTHQQTKGINIPEETFNNLNYMADLLRYMHVSTKNKKKITFGKLAFALSELSPNNPRKIIPLRSSNKNTATLHHTRLIIVNILTYNMFPVSRHLNSNMFLHAPGNHAYNYLVYSFLDTRNTIQHLTQLYTEVATRIQTTGRYGKMYSQWV